MRPVTVLHYLGLPLRTAPLLLIFFCSALMAFALFVGRGFGIPLVFILSIWLFKYAFELLDLVVSGVEEPPVLSVEMLMFNPAGEKRTLTFLVIVVAVFFISEAGVYFFGATGSALMGLALLLVLPAIVAAQAATNSLLQALNPRVFAGLALRLRRDYLWILGCLVAFWLAGSLIVTTKPVPLILRIGWLLYSWLAMFSLIGGVVYQRRLDIGLEDASAVEAVDLPAGPSLEQLRDRHIDRIYAEWRGGAHLNAWQTITRSLQESVDPTEELRWMHERTARWPDQRLANRLAQELLPRLLAERHPGEALTVLRQRLTADTTFRPRTSRDLLQMARLARDGGDRPTARILLNDFEQHFPGDTLQQAVVEMRQQLLR